jgi:hypothetical protein
LKFTSLFVVLSILVLGSIAIPTRADVVPVNNASFESFDPLVNPCSCGMYSIGSIPGWTVFGGIAGSWQPTAVSFPPPLPDGITVAYSNSGTISQTLTTALLPDTTYALSVDVGRRLDVNTNPTGYLTNYTIALYAGSTLLNSFSASNGLIPIGTFADETVTFTSGATVAPGELLSIQLTSTGAQTDFDNVRLTESPEPSSLSLLAGGLGLLLYARRRR